MRGITPPHELEKVQVHRERGRTDEVRRRHVKGCRGKEYGGEASPQGTPRRSASFGRGARDDEASVLVGLGSSEVLENRCREGRIGGERSVPLREAFEECPASRRVRCARRFQGCH